MGAHFVPNLVHIFRHPSPVSQTKSTIKKAIATCRRADKIRTLKANDLVNWAIAYPFHVWAGGGMKETVFRHLLHQCRETCESWESLVRPAIDALQGGQLSNCEAFARFASGETSMIVAEYHLIQCSPRIELNNKIARGLPFAPHDMRDYVKFGAADLSAITSMPTSILPAMQASNQWKMEREEKAPYTNAVHVCISRVPGEDCILVMKMGFHEGWHMLVRLGLASDDTH